MKFWCLILFGIIGMANASLWELHVEGNSHFTEEQILAQLSIPEEFDQMENTRRNFIMRLGRDALQDLYANEGYFDNRIELLIQSQGDSLTQYRIQIQEGKRYQFLSTLIEVPDTARQLIDEQFLLIQPGQPFQFDLIAQDLASIRTLYRRNGYLHLRIDHREQIDSLQKGIHVKLSVVPGTQVRMGDIYTYSYRTLQDNRKESGLTNPKWLAGLWEVGPKETIDGVYLSDFRNKLLNTQIFSQLTIEDTIRTDGSKLSDIIIKGVERTPGSALLGAFYEQSYGFGFSGEVKHRNLMGSFHEGSFSALIAQNHQEAIFGYANPLFLGTAINLIPTAIRLDGRLITSHEQLPTDTLERYDVAGQGNISFGLNSRIRSSSLAELRYIDKFNQTGTQNREFLVKVESGLTFDFTDDPVEPVLGLKTTPTLGIGRSLLPESKSDFSFSPPYPYLRVTNSVYLPIWGLLTSAFAYDYGKMFNPATEEDAQRFYQGGSRSVRGFLYRSIYPYQMIPPQAPDTIPTKLKGLQPIFHRASQEFRLRMPGTTLKDLQIVQFLDWTLVKDGQSGYDQANEMALGLGIRYHWQVLTFRLDYTFYKYFNQYTPEPFQKGRITFDLSQAI